MSQVENFQVVSFSQQFQSSISGFDFLASYSLLAHHLLAMIAQCSHLEASFSLAAHFISARCASIASLSAVAGALYAGFSPLEAKSKDSGCPQPDS